MSSALSLATLLSIAASASAATHAVNLPSGFHTGTQTGIGSWFRANAGADSTNGASWCGYKYSDSDPLIAVPLSSMGGKTYNDDPAAWKAATQKYCGLEAKVTDPSTGKSKIMYIGDGFDEKWVKSANSVDIMLDAFIEIHGDPNGNKNDVIKNVQWELTGNRNTQYAAPGANDAPVDNPSKSSGKPSTPSAYPSKPSGNPSAPSPSSTEPEPSHGSPNQGGASTPVEAENTKEPANGTSNDNRDASKPTQEEASNDRAPSCEKPTEEASGENQDHVSGENQDSENQDHGSQDNRQQGDEANYAANYRRRATGNANSSLKCRGSPRNCASRRA